MDFHASNAPKVLTSKVMVPAHPAHSLEG
jgi:large subunit ribosomal protein L13